MSSIKEQLTSTLDLMFQMKQAKMIKTGNRQNEIKIIYRVLLQKVVFQTTNRDKGTMLYKIDESYYMSHI